MLVPILIAFFLPGYSSISQHISEVALLDHPVALIQRVAAAVTGTSIAMFGAWLFLAKGSKYTAIAAVVFGASMISNGIFVMGSPLHGLYGLGFFMVLVPAFFAAEIAPAGSSLRNISMLVALVIMLYLWLMLSGFDPHAFRGLTQRVATLIIFGWYAVASYSLVRTINHSATRPTKHATAAG
jgi:hypothetical membrane protein